MSVVKRFNELLDLDEIDVLIDEVDKSRHIILSDIPDSLPQGRSSFLIETSPYMKQDTELQIDFIDSEGASIYTEPIADYLEGRARRVSIEVYDDTAPGIATLIIVGELIAVPDGNTIFSDAEQVPPRFQNAYNVRLTKQIVINPTAVNTQPIKFFGQPIINVTETRVGTMVRSEVTGSVTSSFFELEAIPTDENLLFKPYGTNLNPTQGLLSEGLPSSPAKQRSIKAYIESKKRKNRKGKRKNSIFKRSGLLSKTNSPPTFPYRIRPGSFNGEESFRFNTGYVGGNVHFHTSSLGNTFTNSSFYPQAALTEAGLLETPTFDTEKEQGIVNISASMYTASIVDLVSDRIIAVDKPFTNKNVNGEDIILPIYGKGMIHYEAMPTASYAAANLVSYANVTLADMRTFSGDVYKVKVYVKSEGGFDDYKLLAEVPLEGKELLVDDASVGQGDRTGYFIAQSDVDNFWTVSGSTNGESILGAPATNAAYNNNVMLDSVKLSGSLAQPTDHLKFQLNDDYKFELTKGVDYNLSIDVIGNRNGSNYATLAFYISGSSMNRLDNLFYDEYADIEIAESNKYGKRLGTLTITSDDDQVKNFETVNQTFTPDITGDGVLQIRVLQGVWNVADIAIGPAADTGFNPSLFQFKQEMPAELSHKRPDTFEFMAEFYDVNNNLSDTIAYKSGVQFTGTNMTITGEDNVLESNMFIGGDTTASGMHLGGVTSTLPETGTSGAAGSGFMRSVGYTGFISASKFGTGATEGVGKPGFMIYSGSVLPDSGDNYLGVGLELVGESGSLKFRTNPSIFEVKADTFFVGRRHENSATGIGQFMSGSRGNIEISSSLFHLDPINERLIIGAGTTIKAELSANTIRTPAEIGGVQSTALNASSSIDAQGFAKFASASIAGFVVNTEEIKSDNQNLRLKSSGQITGSTVLFSGGKIANWDITGDKLQSLNADSKGIFLDADASSPIIEIRENDDNRLQLYHATNTNWGLVGRSGGNVVFRLGDTNQIAGWTITNSTIQGGNLILGKEGFIKSADYISDISGFIITAAENGYAEFENIKVRGTLATTTFEKESVNAVGGQLFIANSAALSGSSVSSTEVSMSLVNVTGFTKGEVILIKKVHDTGFNTEYVQVVSSSRNASGGDDDPDGLAGKLFVKRGYGYYTRSANRYYGTTVVNDQKYINTGAGTDPPNGTVIPGHSPANNDRVDTDFIPFGTSFAGGNVAGQNMVGSHVHSGSFYINVSGNVNRRTNDSNAFFAIGLYDGSDSDAFIGAKRFWEYADNSTEIDKDLYFPTGNVSGSTVRVALLAVNTDTNSSNTNRISQLTASLDYGSIGSVQLGDSGSVGDPIGGPQDYTDGQVVVSTGRYISGTGNNTVGTGYIRLNANPKNSATPYMDIVERTGSGIYDVELKARLGDLSGVAGTRNVPEGFNGFGLMSEVAFLSGSNIKLEAPTFLLGDLNQNFVSGSNSNIEISSSNFHVDSKNNKFFVGVTTGSKIEFKNKNLVMSSSTFMLGSLGGAFVSGSNSNIEVSSSKFHLKTSGQVTASSMNLKGTSVVEDVAVADYFAYRNIVVNDSNKGQYLDTVTFSNNSGYKTGWILYLDGSLGGEKGMMVTLDDLVADTTAYPIIGIIPPSQNTPGTAPPSSGMGAGHRVIVEAKGGNVFFCRNNSTASDTDDVAILSGGYFFACDTDDPYFFGFSTTREVDGGSTYRDCLMVDAGTRVEFARSNTDYKIQSISSIANIGMSSPAPTAAFNMKSTYLTGTPLRAPAPFTMVGGPNESGHGTLWISANDTAMHDTSQTVVPDGATHASCSIVMQYANNNLYHIGPVRGTTIGGTTQEYVGIGGLDTNPADSTFGALIRQSSVIFNGEAQFNPQRNNHDFRVSAQDSPTAGPKNGENMIRVDAQRGVVGIGCNPGGDGNEGVLAVAAEYEGYMARFRNDGNSENRHGIEIQAGKDNGTGTTGYLIFSDGNGDVIGSIVSTAGTVDYNDFTGAHPSYILKTESNTTDIYTSPSGSVSGSVYPNGTVISMVSSSFDKRQSNQPLHWTVSSSIHQDKRVFGVYKCALPWGRIGQRHDGTIGELDMDWKYKHSIASVGDGVILASNQNGNIEIGDYLTTASGSGGYACKQNDDLLHNYTVAKATENVDWSNVSGSVKLIACTYHCG